MSPMGVGCMNEATGVFDDHPQHAPIARATRMPASFVVLNANTRASKPPR